MGFEKFYKCLTTLSRRANLPSLSCPFVVLFALLPRPCCISATGCAADITICNFIQRRYRSYIACYGHFSRARRCRPLGVMTRKKEHVPRFVLINWSTCATACSFQWAILDIGQTNIESQIQDLEHTGSINILPANFRPDFHRRISSQHIFDSKRLRKYKRQM